jgi:Family of unknown function (DUF6152)
MNGTLLRMAGAFVLLSAVSSAAHAQSGRDLRLRKEVGQAVEEVVDRADLSGQAQDGKDQEAAASQAPGTAALQSASTAGGVAAAPVASSSSGAALKGARFDTSRPPVTLDGGVLELHWADDPQAWITMEVAGAGGGTERWIVAIGSTAALEANRLRDRLAPGSDVSLWAHRATDQERIARAIKINLDDGREIFFSYQGGQQGAVTR